MVHTKNALMMKVGDKSRTVDTEFEDARKVFLSESEQQLLVVKNLQKKEENLHECVSHMKSLSEKLGIAYNNSEAWNKYHTTIIALEGRVISHTQQVKELLSNIHVYVGRIPNIKQLLKERDHALNEYDLQINEVNQMKIKQSDSAKISSAEQKLESRKTVYESQHRGAVEELQSYMSSKTSEFDSYVYKVVSLQLHLFSSFQSMLQTLQPSTTF